MQYLLGIEFPRGEIIKAGILCGVGSSIKFSRPGRSLACLLSKFFFLELPIVDSKSRCRVFSISLTISRFGKHISLSIRDAKVSIMEAGRIDVWTLAEG